MVLDEGKETTSEDHLASDQVVPDGPSEALAVIDERK